MAFYRIKRIEAPAPSIGTGSTARTFYIEDTTTGNVTAYHGEIANENAYNTTAWLAYLADEFALTPNDFGLAP